MGLVAAERETIISWNDEDDFVMINSSQRKVVTQLLKNDGFEIEDDTMFDGTRILTGKLPKNSITIRKVVGKKRATNKRQNPRKNAKRCGAIKADGKKCQSIASKETGRCARHPK